MTLDIWLFSRLLGGREIVILRIVGKAKNSSSENNVCLHAVKNFKRLKLRPHKPPVLHLADFCPF